MSTIEEGKLREHREYIRTVIGPLDLADHVKEAVITLMTQYVEEVINRQSTANYAKINNMNLETMTEIEKKAAIYDNLAMIEQCQNNIKVIQQSMKKEVAPETLEEVLKDGDTEGK